MTEVSVTVTSQKTLDHTKWQTVSGAAQTKKCGQLVDSYSLHFVANGDRVLITRDLDLKVARQVKHFHFCFS